MPSLTPAALRKQIAAGRTDSLYVLVGEDDAEKSAVAAEFAETVDEGLRAFNVEFPQPSQAVAVFRANCLVRAARMYGQVPSRWRLTFRKQGDDWLITNIQSLPVPPLNVADLRADMQAMFDQHAAVFNVWTFVSVLLASSVIFGVVYNNARISLTARSRDLATLRVLGFSRREISSVLIGSLAMEVALAIPLGLLLGYGWAQQFARSFDQETFRLVAVVAPRSYLMAALTTALAAAASALWVRRDLDRLDLIGVLKTRE